MMAANLAGVLVAGFLLGIEVWVVGIGALAYVVSRKTVTIGALVKAGLGLGASAVLYVAAVLLIGRLLSP